MPNDFRAFLAAAEARGLVRRVTRPVDPAWEPACMAKLMFHGLPEAKRFGLYFDHVTGSDMRLATGVLGASARNYALALGVETDGINAHWLEAAANRLVPTLVTSAACQEVVHIGDNASLDMLPIPVWTPGKDVGPYITTNTVTRNADTGVQNMGVYRTQVRDAHSVIVNLSPGRQGHQCARSYLDRGEPAPIAWVVAPGPAVQLAAVANLPAGVDEMALAGGLQQSPVALVRARTSDLLVPANAEIIIEGEVLPGEMAMEGPFGESAGYLSGVVSRPVARITAITHRHQPIYYGLTSQMPPSESTVLQSLSNAGLILHQLHHDHGETSVRDAFIDLSFGGGSGHIIIAMQPASADHPKRIGRLLARETTLKRITIVDADIDIRDREELDWVMSAHFDPARDTEIIDGFLVPMDHAVAVNPQGKKLGSKLIIDATRCQAAGPESLPTRGKMEAAIRSWQEAGLPELEMRRRLQILLDNAPAARRS